MSYIDCKETNSRDPQTSGSLKRKGGGDASVGNSLCLQKNWHLENNFILKFLKLLVGFRTCTPKDGTLAFEHFKLKEFEKCQVLEGFSYLPFLP